MNRLSNDILDAAAVQADKTVIPPRPAVRLAPVALVALAGLSINGVAEGWQVERFWTYLTKPPGSHGMDPYCRTRDIQLYLNRWKLVASGNARR